LPAMPVGRFAKKYNNCGSSEGIVSDKKERGDIPPPHAVVSSEPAIAPNGVHERGQPKPRNSRVSRDDGEDAHK